MGIFGKMRNLIGIEEIDDEISEEEVAEAVAKLEKKSDKKQETSPNSFTAQKYEARDGRPSGATRPQLANTAPVKLVVIEPKGFDECPKLVDNLKSKKPIIINLEKLDMDTARKIFDFLSGATYALNGTVQKVANNIFVFAPENVDISSSVEHKGIDFGGAKNPWR